MKPSPAPPCKPRQHQHATAEQGQAAGSGVAAGHVPGLPKAVVMPMQDTSPLTAVTPFKLKSKKANGGKLDFTGCAVA